MIKKIVAYFEDGTKQEFKGDVVNVIKTATKPPKEYSEDFLTAWNAYPRKIGKGAAWKAWSKVDVDLKVVLNSIETPCDRDWETVL